jgi:hypothetical protein
MPTIKGHSSRRILVVARRESRSVLLAALRGLHLDSLLGDDRRRLDRGMDVRALSDALVCIRSDEQHQIIEAMRHERYRFHPVRRIYIPKKNGKLRPLGLPSWSDKLVGEVIRLLLEAYYEPTFSDHSHGFRPGRGCHTALREVDRTWTGTTWFIEGDISDCFGSLDHQIMVRILRRRSTTTGFCGSSNRC